MENISLFVLLRCAELGKKCVCSFLVLSIFHPFDDDWYTPGWTISGVFFIRLLIIDPPDWKISGVFFTPLLMIDTPTWLNNLRSGWKVQSGKFAPFLQAVASSCGHPSTLGPFLPQTILANTLALRKSRILTEGKFVPNHPGKRLHPSHKQAMPKWTTYFFRRGRSHFWFSKIWVSSDFGHRWAIMYSKKSLCGKGESTYGSVKSQNLNI